MPIADTSDGYPVYRETEHQELWYPSADLARPVDVHIPSALGTLGYYVCVRVPEELGGRLGNVEVKAKIGGLRPDELHLKAGDGITIDDTLPCSQPGYVWRLLCRAKMSRGDGTIELLNWPAELPRVDLLLCTWPRYLVSGQADDWLACQADPHWAPTGIPLGGIGCGRVDLCRDGRFRNFSANNNQDMPLEDPAGLRGAFMAVGDSKTMRSLTTAPIAGMAAAERLEFTGRFPQAQLFAQNCLPGIDVTVVATGTLAPHNLKWASMPGMLLRWQVENKVSEPRTVRCLFSWPNLTGLGGGIAQEETDVGKGDGYYCYWEDTAGRSEDSVDTNHFKGVALSGESPNRPASRGTHLVAVENADGSDAAAADGKGEVWRDVTVDPGSTEIVTMALVWAMPHWVDTKGVDRGHLWQNFFADAEQIAAELIANADEIFAETGSLTELLDKTDLPEPLRRRLANCNYPLVTNSVLYRDGRFSINEGPTEMAGCYGTIDQRLGAHPGSYLFFPDLNARELRQFAAVQSDNGGINHDLGHGHLEAPPKDMHWPDIPCSFIIQCARHAWSNGDAAFDDEMYPRARKALLRDAQWAEAGKGVPQVGKGLGTSYDGYHYEGTTPYVGTLWIAALNVFETWMLRRGDEDLLPKIAEWRQAAIERMDADIWNGSFYRTCGGIDGPGRDTCHAGIVAGQFFSRLLTGQNVLPDDRLLPCIDALMRLNGNDKFALPPDEVSPDGECTVDFSWLPYVQAFGLTAAASVMNERVQAVWQKAIAAADNAGARPCDTRLMYRPITGEPSWGSYYMTAPAEWLVYDALLDFYYSPNDGILRLNPQFEGTAAVVHPLWWGLVEKIGDEVSLHIERLFTKRPLEVRIVELRDELPTSSYLEVELPEPIILEPDIVLEWSITS